jgi:hypothetical protein
MSSLRIARQTGICALFSATANLALATVITFSPLTGPTDASYLGHSEGGFTVTPASGSFFQALLYGNPIPSIYDGPILQPSTAAIQVTQGGALFTFNSVDYSSNNGDALYSIQGFNGASVAYNDTGVLAGTFGPFTFSTLPGAHTHVTIDRLLITVSPGAGVTSVNLDNINLGSGVPEPATLAMLGAGLCSLFGLKTLRRPSRPRGFRAPRAAA